MPRACEDDRVRSLLAVAALALLPAVPPLTAVAAPGRPGPSGSAARAPSCRPSRAQVLARSGGSLIFYRATGPYDGKYGSPTALFGCTRVRQRPVAIRRFDEFTGPLFSHVSVRGDYAAYAEEDDANTCPAYPGQTCEALAVFFQSVDLRTGRVRAGPTPGVPDALVVTARGWIAWVAGGASRSPGALFARDSGGRRELDPGPVDPASLRVSGATVFWHSAIAPAGAATLG